VNNVSDGANRRRRGHVQSRVKVCGRISIDMEMHVEQGRKEGISSANPSLDTVGRATA
jgi:hypothetical protein